MSRMIVLELSKFSSMFYQPVMVEEISAACHKAVIQDFIFFCVVLRKIETDQPIIELIRQTRTIEFQSSV